MRSAVRPPERAVLLSAGFGERLRPLTEDRAKPSLPLMNHPLILHALERLKRGGVERVAVNLHHAPASLTRILEETRSGLPEVIFSPEETILGTGGGVVAALRLLGGGSPLLVTNGDALSDLDLSFLAARHRAAVEKIGAAATLAVRPRLPADPFTPVWVDFEGAICGIGEIGARGSPHVFMGVQILEPAAFDRLPRSGPSDLVKDLYMPLLREGRRLGTALHEGWWIEIGSPGLYLAAHLDLLRRKEFLSSLPPSAGRLVPGLRRVFAAGEGAHLAGATLGEAVLGEGAVAGSGCTILRSLLGRGARVEEGARIEECIVWDGARVGAGTEARRSLMFLSGRSTRTESLT